MNGKDLFLIPNAITLSRIFVLIPAIYFLHTRSTVGMVLTLSWIFISDFLDGYLARRLHQTSFIGAILDPVSDKIVVLCLFSYFFYLGKLPIIYYFLILARDTAQLLSVPILLLWKKIEFKVKPKLIPKWGTALNFIILAILGISFLPTEIISYFSFLESLSTILYLISGTIEVYILITYLPRFYQIYIGNHDTFE